ncbi:MAG: deoxyribodipyrimidine photo-lyase [Deltaproteobacteria bacterium]|nr:MAG: deoxyribodipyrimidine photo-lyase [Deltaproteobacteria bacterium]
MIQPERIQPCNDRPIQKGRYFLYWMQASQRAVFNHALEYSIRQANELNKPVVVLFGITDRFPEANERHYAFMLQGLREVREGLDQRGIQFVVLHKSPELAAVQFSKDASMVVTDAGYLRIQKEWRYHVAKNASCPVVQLESDVIVPVSVASDREAYSAAVLRPRIKKHLKRYLVPLKETPVRKDSLGFRFNSLDVQNVKGLLNKLSLDRSVCPVKTFHGGWKDAMRLLDAFIMDKLKYYKDLRNDPGTDYGSHMSPYLHFGQISPLDIALKVSQARGRAKAAKEAYLEELVVRRELSMNFVHYNPNYDAYEALPDWAKKTLKVHEKDKREYLYNLQAWEQARTHDPYWNAAQREMVITGKMHNYIRMYWGKKILEWSKTPEDAYRTALHLNNKYELDGRDPNGFAGVAWCFGKHDRAWPERPIFGKVRYMNAAGLRRKFDIETYVRRVDALSKGSFE